MIPQNGQILRRSVALTPGVYFLPDGLTVAGDDVVLDGNGALLIGAGREGVGVRIEGGSGATVRNIQLREYRHGIRAHGCSGLTIAGNQITSTAEVPANTVFLDIWLPAERAYGSAILLENVSDSRIEGNDLQHQQSGLLTYGCSTLTVRRNLANYNSGYGFHLFGTCDSLFEGNSADYCCRFEPRDGGPNALHYGHMGADATGFLAVEGSCRNVFRRNTARLGGDGFFLAGFSPDGRKVGCDDNLFEENDASLSPNISFEATFCHGNRFRGNYADRSNYGFWLGFSWDSVLEGNRMVMNRQAGIAVENGHGFRVEGNDFQGNGHGVLLWSKHVPQFAEAFPESLTSYEWEILGNTFLRNGKAIRIAADQDHGIRPMPDGQCGKAECRPRRHAIRGNVIQDNRVGVELFRADSTCIEQNTLNVNVEANLRQSDCEGTISRDNLGSAGGYL